MTQQPKADGPPFGLNCLSCPYAIADIALGPAARRCHGMPSTTEVLGRDATTGEFIYIYLYRRVTAVDWCAQHPGIRQRAEQLYHMQQALAGAQGYSLATRRHDA